MENRLSWVLVAMLALLIWIAFGAVPYFLDLAGVIDVDQVRRVAPFGGMFGAAEAFFSGFALIAVIISIQQQRVALSMQAEELRLATSEMKASADAQSEIAMHQKNAISLEVIMPFMSEISSDEMRDSIIVLSKLCKNEGFDEYYSEILALRDNDVINEEKLAELERIDKARRRYVGVFHKMHRLSRTGVVDDEIVKVVLGPDHCWLLLNAVEPLEAKIRDNYSRETFVFAENLYSDNEINLLGKHHKS